MSYKDMESHLGQYFAYLTSAWFCSFSPKNHLAIFFKKFSQADLLALEHISMCQ